MFYFQYFNTYHSAPKNSPTYLITASYFDLHFTYFCSHRFPQLWFFIFFLFLIYKNIKTRIHFNLHTSAVLINQTVLTLATMARAQKKLKKKIGTYSKHRGRILRTAVTIKTKKERCAKANATPNIRPGTISRHSGGGGSGTACICYALALC